MPFEIVLACALLASVAGLMASENDGRALTP